MAAGVTKNGTTKTGWEATVLFGADSFTLPLFGGFDGLNILEKDPFGNHVLDDTTDPKDNYALETVRRAIDIVSDAEEAEYNIITAPNIVEPTLTQKLIDVLRTAAMLLRLSISKVTSLHLQSQQVLSRTESVM